MASSNGSKVAAARRVRTYVALAIASLSLGIVSTVSTEASAQEKTILQEGLLELDERVAKDRLAFRVADADTSPISVAKFSDECLRRLQPIEQRFREDPRLRSSGIALGFGAIALSMIRRRSSSLTFVGTHALRLGLDKQLAEIRHRSGFVLEPSIGHRAVAVTLSRTVD